MRKPLIIAIILIVIVILGGLLRLFRLSSSPSELHRDELAIGYNAFSLVTSGKDEHGERAYPIIFKSFGDYKLPGLIYMSVPLVQKFGLSPLTTRLPTALLSTALIVITFYFVLELTNSNTRALVASALLAVSQWHIFLSRTAYEPIAGLTLHILAILILLKARKNNLMYLISLPIFLLAFLTYNVPLLLLPLLIMLYIASFILALDKKIIPKHIPYLAMIGILFVACAVGFSSLNSAKAKTTILSSPMLESVLIQEKDEAFIAGMPHSLRILSSNKYYFFVSNFLRRYIAAFNPDYIFFSGGSNSWHSLINLNLGNISIIYLPFLLLGSAYVIRKSVRGSKEHIFILGMLLIAPIPDALTIDAPVTNRLMDFHYVLTIISALGVANLLEHLKRKPFFRITSTGVFVAFIYFVVTFLGKYFYLHSRLLTSSWHEGTRALGEHLEQYENNYSTIIVDAGSTQGKYEELVAPYIYVAYYTQYPPSKLQTAGVREERGGYSVVTSMAPYIFKSLTKHDLSGTPILYVSRYPEPPDSLVKEAWAIKLFEIMNVRNEVVWTGYQVQDVLTAPSK